MSRAAILLTAALIGLAGCGKKPVDIDAPPGSDPRLFPRPFPVPDAGRDPLLRDPPVSPAERPRS